MSEVKFGASPIGIHSKNALRRACDIIENNVIPELEGGSHSGVASSAEILREITCGYGYAGFVDEPLVGTHVDHLDEYDKTHTHPPALTDELNALVRVCAIASGPLKDEVGQMRTGSLLVERRPGIEFEEFREAKESIPGLPPYKQVATATRSAGEEFERANFLKNGLNCGVNALAKLSCGLSQGEKPSVNNEVGCLRLFQRGIREREWGVAKKRLQAE